MPSSHHAWNTCQPSERFRAATSFLCSCLKRLRQDVGKAVLCLARPSNPVPTDVRATTPEHSSIQKVINELSVAALVAQTALDEHETATARIRAPSSADGSSMPASQQQHVPVELAQQLQSQLNSCRSLYTALDQLQQAASSGMSSARAAVRSAYADIAVDMQQVFDALMNMAESALQAQTLLRQYADIGNTRPAATVCEGGNIHATECCASPPGEQFVNANGNSNR